MAFTRKFLSALGIDADKVDEIITAHAEVTEALKADRDKYKADADKLQEVERQLGEVTKERDELKSRSDDGFKEKYEKEKKAFEDFKNDITAKETKAAKEKAVRSYFEGKNIKDASLEIAMRGATAEIEALELDKDGKIKDSTALDSLVSGTFAGLVSKSESVPPKTSTPPGGGVESGSNQSRAAQLYATHYQNLYGKGEKS